uniref:Chitinase-like protein PB1E7.04c-like n=1 Tax=Saccoglossus kowalevskii TaxID=10224 RepID=A0ABM0M0T5_SACKO|nr:PREDICTED: chitinase-like protein PB1E7.04c-like [Saccoglossus kowalevskii]
MAEDCGSGCGDVLSWTDFTTSDLYNVNTQDIYCDVVPSTELPDMASSSPIVNDNVSAKETLYITSNNTHGSIAASSSKTYSISTSTASPDITEPTTNSSYIQKTSPVDMTTVGYSDPSKSKTDIEETSSSASPGALTTARPDMQQTSLNMGVILSSTVRYGEPEFSSSVKVIASTTGRPDTISSMGTTTSTTVGPDISDANTGGIIASTTNRPDISSEVSSRSMNTPAMVQPNISDTISTKQLYISHAISSVDITKIGFTASSTRSQGIREASSSESIFPSTSRRSDILEISSSEGFAASTSGIPDTSSNKPDIPDANVNITALAPESPDTPEISSSEGIITLTSRSPDMPDTSSKQGIVVSTSARPVVPEIGIASTSKWQDISDTSSNKGSIALTSERPDVPEITSSVGIITSTSSPDVQVISSSVVTPASATARPDIPQEGLSTRISPSTTITSKFTETSTGIEHGESSLSASYIPAEISRTIPRTLTASTYSKTLTSIPPEYKSRSQSYTTVRRSTEEVSTENKVIQPKQTSATPGSCDDAEYSQTSFVFRPITDTGSYVRHYLLQGREFTQFTLCLWIKLNSLSELRTLVRYETVMHTNEIVINVGTISQITGVSLIISDNIEILREVPLQLNKWQHVCIEWDSLGSSGVLKIFLNYATVYTMSIPVADVVIPGTGFFTLGDIEHSFVGEIAFLNMWSRVLTGNEIRDLAKDGANGCGDIISWSDFKDSIFFNVDFGEFKDIASDLPTTLGRVETSVPSIGVEYTSAVMPTSKTVLLETIINSRQTGESSSLLNTEQTAVTTQPVNSGSPFSTVTTSQTTVPSSSKVSTERVPIELIGGGRRTHNSLTVLSTKRRKGVTLMCIFSNIPNQDRSYTQQQLFGYEYVASLPTFSWGYYRNRYGIQAYTTTPMFVKLVNYQ